MAAMAVPSPDPGGEASRLPVPSHNPLPLSASQEAQVREIFYSRVRNRCADEIKGVYCLAVWGWLWNIEGILEYKIGTNSDPRGDERERGGKREREKGNRGGIGEGRKRGMKLLSPLHSPPLPSLGSHAYSFALRGEFNSLRRLCSQPDLYGVVCLPGAKAADELVYEGERHAGGGRRR